MEKNNKYSCINIKFNAQKLVQQHNNTNTISILSHQIITSISNLNIFSSIFFYFIKNNYSIRIDKIINSQHFSPNIQQLQQDFENQKKSKIDIIYLIKNICFQILIVLKRFPQIILWLVILNYFIYVQKSKFFINCLTYSLNQTLPGPFSLTNALYVSSNNYMIITGSNDKNMYIWYWNDGTQQYVLNQTILADNTAVLTVDMHENLNLVASGGKDRILKIWNYSGNSFVLIQNLTFHTNAITNVKFSSDGNLLISSSYDMTSFVWKYNNLANNYFLNSLLVGHSSYVYTADINTNNTLIITGSEDNTIKIWYLNTQFDIFQIQQTINANITRVNSLAFINQNMFASGGLYYLKIWQYNITSNNFSLLQTHNNHTGNVTLITWKQLQMIYSISSSDNYINLWSYNSTNVSFYLNNTVTTTSNINKIKINKYGSKLIISNQNFNIQLYLEVLNCNNTHENGYDYLNNFCSCDVPFIWDYINLVPLLDCTLDINSNGTNSSLSMCFCNSNYLWSISSALCTFNCMNDSHSNGNNVDATSCYCIVNYLWQTTLSACSFNCSLDSHSNTINLSPTSCYCNTNFYWQSSHFLCSYNCSLDPNSNGINNNVTTCNCNTHYLWSTIFNLCSYNCSIDQYSNGTSMTSISCYCLNNFLWSTDIFSCLLNCYLDVNSNGSNINATVCYCNSNYIWSTIKKSCQYNCSLDPNSNGTNNDSISCYCNSVSYIWSQQLFLCKFNCLNDPNSNGININAISCECNSNFVWQILLFFCYYDCSSIMFSTGINQNAISCICSINYIWNTSKSICQLNCSADLNSNGTNKNINQCNCNVQYIWDSINLNCKFSPVNCSNDIYSIGYIASSNQCSCIKDFIWNISSLSCQINCNLDPYSTGMNIGIDECQCKNLYQWDFSLQICVFNLTNIMYAISSCISTPNINIVFIFITPMLKFIDDFYYYAYHKRNYDNSMMQYVASLVNLTQSKWVPIYLVDYVNQYQNKLSYQINTLHDIFHKTPSHFARLGQDIFYLKNTFDYFTSTIPFSLFTFFLIHLIYPYVKKYKIIQLVLQSFSSYSYLLIGLIGDNIQYLSFRCFTQMYFLVPTVAFSYVNLIVCYISLFYIIIYAVSGFFIFKYSFKKQFKGLLQIMKPCTNSAIFMMISLIVKVLNGFVHSYLYNLPNLQMKIIFLVQIINLLNVIIFHKVFQSKFLKAFLIIQNTFRVLLNLFFVIELKLQEINELSENKIILGSVQSSIIFSILILNILQSIVIVLSPKNILKKLNIHILEEIKKKLRKKIIKMKKTEIITINQIKSQNIKNDQVDPIQIPKSHKRIIKMKIKDHIN